MAAAAAAARDSGAADGCDQDVGASITLVLAGDAGVGKSSLARCFLGEEFRPLEPATTGVAFWRTRVSVDGVGVKLQILDATGEPQAAGAESIRGAAGVMVVYDITSEASFGGARAWLHLVKQHADAASNNVVLVGAKADEAGRRAVARERGQAMADEWGARFYEASASSNTNVQEAFLALTSQAVAQQLGQQGQQEEQQLQQDELQHWTGLVGGLVAAREVEQHELLRELVLARQELASARHELVASHAWLRERDAQLAAVQEQMAALQHQLRVVQAHATRLEAGALPPAGG